MHFSISFEIRSYPGDFFSFRLLIVNLSSFSSIIMLRDSNLLFLLLLAVVEVPSSSEIYPKSILGAWNRFHENIS